jgi:hypothetical protein
LVGIVRSRAEATEFSLVKRYEREAYHSLPSGAEIENGGTKSPLPPMRLYEIALI